MEFWKRYLRPSSSSDTKLTASEPDTSRDASSFYVSPSRNMRNMQAFYGFEPSDPSATTNGPWMSGANPVGDDIKARLGLGGSYTQSHSAFSQPYSQQSQTQYSTPPFDTGKQGFPGQEYPYPYPYPQSTTPSAAPSVPEPSLQTTTPPESTYPSYQNQPPFSQHTQPAPPTSLPPSAPPASFPPPATSTSAPPPMTASVSSTNVPKNSALREATVEYDRATEKWTAHFPTTVLGKQELDVGGTKVAYTYHGIDENGIAKMTMNILDPGYTTAATPLQTSQSPAPSTNPFPPTSPPAQHPTGASTAYGQSANPTIPTNFPGTSTFPGTSPWSSYLAPPVTDPGLVESLKADPEWSEIDWAMRAASSVNGGKPDPAAASEVLRLLPEVYDTVRKIWQTTRRGEVPRSNALTAGTAYNYAGHLAKCAVKYGHDQEKKKQKISAAVDKMSKLFDECGIDLTNEDHSKLPHLPTVLINGGENRWRDNQSDVLSWAVGREKGQTRATFTMEEGDERLRRYMENMSLLDVFTEDHENQEMRYTDAQKHEMAQAYVDRNRDMASFVAWRTGGRY